MPNDLIPPQNDIKKTFTLTSRTTNSFTNRTSQKLPGRPPHHKEKDYDPSEVTARREWLSRYSKVNFKHISHFSIETNEVRGNVENFIGVAQVPIGIVGPLEILGDYARGTFYVPFATTEGAMVATHQRGAMAITRSGGAYVNVLKDENHLAPIFILKEMGKVNSFIAWLHENFPGIRARAESTTAHGRILDIKPCV